MKDIYERLREIGLDRPFVQRRVLPDWWDDAEANEPGCRAIAEIAVARYLHCSVGDVRAPAVPLSLPTLPAVRLKKQSSTPREKTLGTLHTACEALRSVCEALDGQPDGQALPAAPVLRREILASHNVVDLAGLLALCWGRGIAVMRLDDRPANSARISGMAAVHDGRPCIVLGSSRKSPPWLAFHLAHELGHIALGHVGTDGSIVADTDEQADIADADEIAADEFAMHLLGGDGVESSPAPERASLESWLNWAGAWEADGVDSGTAALVLGRRTANYGLANRVVAALGKDRGGPEMVASYLERHLADDLSDRTAQWLSAVGVTV